MGLPGPPSSQPSHLAQPATSPAPAAATAAHRPPVPPPQPPPPASHPRRPAPIQTSAIPPANNRTHDVRDRSSSSPERPPVSPITPTDGASSPAPPLVVPSDQPSLESRPPSSKSFNFTVPASFSGHDSGSSRPPSQRSHARHPGSLSNSASPPRPRSSSSSQQAYQFTSSARHVAGAALPPNTSSVPPATFMPRPSSLALDEAANTDMAALKACISVLQLQQAKSRRDIAALQRMKDAAVGDPVGFTQALQAGRLDDGSGAVPDPLAATFAGADDDDDDDDDAEERDAEETNREDKFGKMPRPQNVVRCPPVNWAKYHIVGEPLERMHEEQRRRPDPGEPWRESSRDAVVFAPYSPFKDHLGGGGGQSQGGQQQGMVTRKGGKRPG